LFEQLLEQMRSMALSARSSYYSSQSAPAPALLSLSLDESYCSSPLSLSPRTAPTDADTTTCAFDLLDALTLERVLFYAGLLRMRLVCRRWASIPLRNCAVRQRAHVPLPVLSAPAGSHVPPLLTLLRRVECVRVESVADVVRAAPSLASLTAPALGDVVLGDNLRALTVDGGGVAAMASTVSLAVALARCQRSLRRLSLRHVRVRDWPVLRELALEALELKQVPDVDALLASGELAAALGAPELLRALTLDYRPARGAAPIGAALAALCPRFEQLRALSLMFHRLDAAGLAAIGSAPAPLARLHLSGCAFGGGSLAALAPLAGTLRELELYSCAVADVDAELEALARLSRLRSLMLFDGVAARHLHLLEPLAELADLYSDSVVLDAVAADALAALPRLAFIHVAAADERGLARTLAGPLRTRLAALDFGREYNAAAIDDAAVGRLCAALPRLYFVDLDGATRLTTDALVALARLSHLRHVNMRDADYAVSDFAFERLARFLEHRAGCDELYDDAAASPHETLSIASSIGSPPPPMRRAVAAAAAAAAAAATHAGASPAAAAAAAAAAMAAVVAAHTPQNERLAAHARPSSSRLCTRDFPLDSWSACVRLAKQHFDTYSSRDTTARHALIQEELELIAAGGPVLAPMLGERSLEALKSLARAFAAAAEKDDGLPFVY
jgi:hypothetical protein